MLEQAASQHRQVLPIWWMANGMVLYPINRGQKTSKFNIYLYMSNMCHIYIYKTNQHVHCIECILVADLL